MAQASAREIKNEDGDVIARVWEENPGTMMKCLKCRLADGERELLEYPDNWHKLSDRKLFALCKKGGDEG